MAALTNDDILCIRSYLKDGYSISEIEEVSGYTYDDIINVKNDVQIKIPKPKSKLKGPDGFSDSVVRVICTFLEQGATDDQAYDALLLYKKAYSRKRFHKLCSKLRNKTYYLNIIKDFNIPKEPTSDYTSPYINYTYDDPDRVKVHFTADSIKEKKELRRRKEEMDKKRTAEAIARHEREVKEREEYRKKISSQKPKPDTIIKPITVPPPAQEVTAEDVLPKFNNTTTVGKTVADKITDVCVMLQKDISIDIISNLTELPRSVIINVKEGKEYTEISKRFGIVPQRLRGKLDNILSKIE